jgi:hypothetical protein
LKETKSQNIIEFDEKLGKEELKRKLLERIKNLSLSFSYEEIGLLPRSFSRVLIRFFQQVFSDVENLVIEEYRFYRYLFLTTLKCLLMLIFVPFLVNLFAKSYVVHPLIEYFWNQPEQEIFLNSYQQKRAFAELNDYEEKLYFESLILPAYLSNNSSSETETERDIEINNKVNLLVSGKPEPTKFSKSLFSKSESKPSSSFLPTLPKGLSPNRELSIGEREPLSSIAVILPISPKGRREPTDIPKTAKAIEINKDREQLAKKISQKIVENEMASRSRNGRGEIAMNKALNELKVLVMQQQIQDGFDISESKKEPSKKEVFEQKLQEKTIEIAVHYNNLSIEALTNFFADLLSLLSLCYLFVVLDIQITVTKSFLLEVFFGLDDTRKSLFILLVTDLLVGYHSSNLWELFFEFLFNHYGLPENQTSIFLLVATLPVLLDVLFKYIIFRHLNRSSPATVATYHAMIE